MKCGNCNIDFPNREAMIAHMMLVHGCEFDEQSHPEYADIQKKIREHPDFKSAKGLMQTIGAWK